MINSHNLLYENFWPASNRFTLAIHQIFSEPFNSQLKRRKKKLRLTILDTKKSIQFLVIVRLLLDNIIIRDKAVWLWLCDTVCAISSQLQWILLMIIFIPIKWSYKLKLMPWKTKNRSKIIMWVCECVCVWEILHHKNETKCLIN